MEERLRFCIVTMGHTQGYHIVQLLHSVKVTQVSGGDLNFVREF